MVLERTGTMQNAVRSSTRHRGGCQESAAEPAPAGTDLDYTCVFHQPPGPLAHAHARVQRLVHQQLCGVPVIEVRPRLWRGKRRQ